MIGQNTTRWNTALVILSFVTTFKRSKKLGYIHTVSNPYHGLRRSDRRSDHLLKKAIEVYGDEVPLPEIDLDHGKQDVTYLLMTFLVLLGRCPQQGYGHCLPSPGPHRSIDASGLKLGHFSQS